MAGQRLAVTATVAVVLAGAIARGVGPAEGVPVVHRVVHHDPAHDVVAYPVERAGRHPAPLKRDPDITRVSARHGGHNVWVRFHVRRLLRATGATPDAATRFWRSRIVTPQREYRLEGELLPQDGGAPFIQFQSGADCRRLHVSFDYAHDVVVTQVPRGCIGKPRWVRVGVVFSRQPEFLRQPLDRRIVLFDDAFSPEPPSRRSWGTLSRRLYQ